MKTKGNSGEGQGKMTGKTLMEKHINTVLLGLVTAGIVFIYSGVFNLSINMARLTEKVDTITESSKTFLTKDQADARGKMRDLQIDGLTKVQIDLATRVGKLESKIK